ncbi:ATP-binding cassette protein subfamily F, member 3 [Trypanosoma rangeli]|uniref:ATP-binding cassette protein subfamily F, member 3 n=1 Tax=Trypanosoma rangeli TaxID=5698 RepID=A0A422NHP3_TRYRA|nr:ATP-binding cassette protein subfamily F, member 3 [Trypanosoma rangeli]RNF04998.1 ATP-binding cassette protein subfamily F, member 3 [Trypanosoma rangeli]|eukprot:RNF04998.1 ATP-binding cassette protein subfamily F, member 3 [Trypanosoma rangeli]
MDEAEGVNVVEGPRVAISRKERKRQEKFDKRMDELRILNDCANNVNVNGDSPFSVTWEDDQHSEGSRDIAIRKVSVSVNGKVLFKDTLVKLSAGSRYGLMGPNGRGKSTILRLLSTRELPVQSNLDLLLVEQEQEFHASDLSAVQAVLESHKKQKEYLNEAVTLREKVELDDAEMARLQFLEDELDMMGATQAEARARRILFGLGFPTEWHERPTKSFSGGWRKRIALASAVFIEPDVLMLDEPTNHLDLNAVIWLESYLCEQYSEKARRPKTLIVVSHDAGFLDEVCTHMVHVENHLLNYYRGGFSTFDEQLRQRHQELDKKYATVSKTIKEKKRNGMSNAQVDDWIKDQVRTGRLDPIYLEKRRDYIVNFPFAEPPELPDACIFKLEEVSFNYPGGPVLFENVNCALWTDSRITLCGPNGIGKSTLLNLMTGELSPTGGVVTINRKVRIGRYNQHFVDKLPLEKTPVEYIRSLGVNEEDKARRQLGSFGLEGIVHKNQIATLSGGQKARVAFAAISTEKPHFLLFDEPTNHLDVESIGALCQAIKVFKGGVLVVTHDARLIEETEMQIWEAGNRTVTPFNGTLYDYKKKVRLIFEREEAGAMRERKQIMEQKHMNNRLRRQGDGRELEEVRREMEEEKQQQQAVEVDEAFDFFKKRSKKKKEKEKAAKVG